MVSASPIGIISEAAQGLLHCREPYRPEERELGRFGLMASREADTSTEPTITVPTNRSAPTVRAAATRVVLAFMKFCGSRRTWPQPFGASQYRCDPPAGPGIGNGDPAGLQLELVRRGETTLEEVGRMVLTT